MTLGLHEGVGVMGDVGVLRLLGLRSTVLRRSIWWACAIQPLKKKEEGQHIAVGRIALRAHVAVEASPKPPKVGNIMAQAV